MEAIREFAPSALQTLEAAETVNIECDDTVSPGGCLVQSLDSDVDATLETQLDQIATLLLGGGEANGHE